MNSIAFIFILFSVTNSYVYMYKSLNKKYNGVFTYTNRGSWMLYANTFKHIDEMYPKRFLALEQSSFRHPASG